MSGPAAYPRGLGWVRTVRVGSANRPKVAAARAALRPFAPEALVSGVAVDSGVPEQPVGFEEIARGAGNRARAALASAEGPRAQLGIGIEDGLVALEGGLAALGEQAARVTSGESGHPSAQAPRPGAPMDPYFNLGCAVVTDGQRTGLGFSSGFAYPPAVTAPAAAGRDPIGDLFDALWRERRGERSSAPSGRGMGNVGKLTGGVLTRQEYGRHAVLCALIRFLHPDLYEDGEVAA